MIKTNTMLSRCRVFLLFAFVCFISTAEAQTKKVRLFIIGNSFSGNAASYLPKLAEEGGYELEIGRAELGGCSLERHWRLVDTTEAASKAYKGRSLKEMLSEGTWDVVTLQQYSLLSGDPDTYHPYAEKLYNLIKSIQPNAKVVFHQTWAYRTDAKAFGKMNGEERAADAQEMYNHARAAYHAIADQLKVRVIPTGDAFWIMNSDPEWAYKKDTAYNFENPVEPALPDQTNSLHVGYRWVKGKLQFDANHANAAGCYLGSLVWYRFLFQAPVKDVKYKPEQVSEELAAHLKGIAAEVGL